MKDNFSFCLLDKVSTPLSLSTSDTLPFGFANGEGLLTGGVKKAVMCFDWYHFLYPEVYVHLFLFSRKFLQQRV